MTRRMTTTTGKTKLHKTVKASLEQNGFLEKYLESDMVLLCKVEPYSGMSDEEFDIVCKSNGRNVVLYKAIDSSKPLKEGMQPAVMSRKGFEKMASRKELSLSFLETQGVLRIKSDEVHGIER